jgi:hypothetical protein
LIHSRRGVFALLLGALGRWILSIPNVWFAAVMV